ncbi:DUF427 domain-containing protein [Arthrobacter sp. Soc17.1.1.1]|uniref:DUF427 domain-containing protein n=1 Tax=Arthrobacter sp. Soc17.1.1.1 TaxID=3121277 RepID=UPI002FE4CDD4
MPKAVWNDRVIAESADTVQVEGNHYFPPESIAQEYFVPSDTQTVCHWKGTAAYYSLEVDGERNADAAWTYPEPKEAAENIRGHYAFWKGVTVSD